jgi:hypothetical protein
LVGGSIQSRLPYTLLVSNDFNELPLEQSLDRWCHIDPPDPLDIASDLERAGCELRAGAYPNVNSKVL